MHCPIHGFLKPEGGNDYPDLGPYFDLRRNLITGPDYITDRLQPQLGADDKQDLDRLVVNVCRYFGRTRFTHDLLEDIDRLVRLARGPETDVCMVELRTVADVMEQAVRDKQQGNPARAGAHHDRRGTGHPGAAGKKKHGGGKRPLEQSKPLKFQAYDRIQQEHRSGELHRDTVDRLKADNQFVEQVKDAGLKLNTGLVRQALAFFDQRRREQARKNQETDPA